MSVQSSNERAGSGPGPVLRSLSPGSTLAIVIGLLAVASIGWGFTARMAGDMSSMAMGLGQLSVRDVNDMSVVTFMLMWLAMTAAMMLPTVIPSILVQYRLADGAGSGTTTSASFVVGYLAMWLLAGLVPLAANLGFRALPTSVAHSSALTYASAAVLVLAGAYQFTPLKLWAVASCLDAVGCAVPAGGSTSGPLASLAAGARHARSCITCCWAMMAVLLVVGLMNLPWMLVLAAIFTIEKSWDRGLLLSRIAGVALIVAGLVAAVDPAFLVTISGGAGPMKPGGGM